MSSVVQAALLAPVARRVDRSGRRPFLRGGAALGLAGSLVLAFSDSLLPFLLAMALFGAATAMLSTSAAAVVGDVIGGRGGTAIAGYQMSADAGASIGPLVAGAAVRPFSFGRRSWRQRRRLGRAARRLHDARRPAATLAGRPAAQPPRLVEVHAAEPTRA